MSSLEIYTMLSRSKTDLTLNAMQTLLLDYQVVGRILSHSDNKTTDMGTEVWREPTENHTKPTRFDAELALIRRSTVPFCPSAMLIEKGSYVARTTAEIPILVLRGMDGEIRVFINSCSIEVCPLTVVSAVQGLFLVLIMHGHTA